MSECERAKDGKAKEQHVLLLLFPRACRPGLQLSFFLQSISCRLKETHCISAEKETEGDGLKEIGKLKPLATMSKSVSSLFWFLRTDTITLRQASKCSTG